MIHCNFAQLLPLRHLRALEVDVPLTRELAEITALTQITQLTVTRSCTVTASIVQVLEHALKLRQVREVKQGEGNEASIGSELTAR